MGDTIRLLYAEDNPQDADLTRAHFEQTAPEFHIEFVVSGKECLARLNAQPYDLVLLDNRLPDGDGIDLLGKLKGNGRAPPIVLITGVGDDEIAAQALRYGAADYVSKSETDYLDTLPELLRSLVTRHRGRYLRDSNGEQHIQQILYVEHHPMDVELTRHHFEIAAPHLQLHHVSNASYALDLLSSDHQFDLVLTDLRLPGMSALELIREVQHRGIDIPFVVITGKGDEATAVSILRLGAYDYLIKRKDYLVQLPHAIDNALHRFRLHQSTGRLNAELTALNATLEHKVTERTAELQREIEVRKRTEQSLRATERDLRDAEEVGAIGSYIIDVKEDKWRSTSTLDGILGISKDYPHTRESWLKLIHPAHHDEMKNMLRALMVEQRPIEKEFRIVRNNDGAERWVRGRGRVEFGTDGYALRMVGIIQDITDLKQSEIQLRLAAKVFEQSGEGFFITDANRNIVRVNQAYTNICGYLESEVLGQNPPMLTSGIQNEDFYRDMWESIDTTGYWQGELLDCRKDGELYSKWLSFSRVLGAQGEVTHYIGIFSDISQHKQNEAHIHRLANFDALTGLPNRRLLNDRVSQLLSIAQRNHTQLAVMFIDLDHFKNINDSLGHSMGDEVLVQVALRLDLTIREEDIVSRLGGDEFVLVLQNTDANGAAHVAEKLLRSVGQPYQIEQHDLIITPSIGIAMYPADGEDFDTLSKCADAAMYRAKQGGRNNYRFFTTEMQAHSTRRLHLENALRHALERDQLSLHYQPQMSMSGGLMPGGLIIGAEALLRWQHPEFGMVTPGEFIPIAEDSGLILPIGEWVIRTAVQQMKSWIVGGITPMSVAVNLSAVQFRQPNLPELVTQILEEAQLPPHCLELELTEGIAMDDPLGAIAIMNNLHERGVRMSIDDFGTGYSSLSYLKRFKVYKLKIDQSFVRDIAIDPDDKAIVIAIISLAQSLNLQTIAEGVETEEQMAFLRAQGCNDAQGFLFCKPLPVDQFEAFVRERAQG